MLFEPVQKVAILKLLNQLTTKPRTISLPSQTNKFKPPPSEFKDELTMYGVPLLSRIGLVIAKFERIFNPDDGNNCISLDGNRFYLQDILGLINYIEEVNLYGKVEPIAPYTLEALQCSQHVHGLILCIREWIASFYYNKNYIASLFPQTNDPHFFSLNELRDENYCHMSILIFSILQKFSQAFPEYFLLIDFFFTCFPNLKDITNHAEMDSNAINDLLLKSIVHARKERDNMVKQIVQKQQQIEQVQLQRQLQEEQMQQQQERQQQPQTQHENGRTTVGVEQPSSSSRIVDNNSNSNSSNSNIRTSHLQNHPHQSHQPPPQPPPPLQHQPSPPTQQPLPLNIVLNKSDESFQTMLEMKTKKLKKSTCPVITLKPASDPDPVSDSQQHYCAQCQKFFPTAYKLQRHNFMHSGIRPFVCSWPNCKRSFNDNYHLKRHHNSHTGNKPFSCSINGCEKVYSRMEDLRTHIKTHFPHGDDPNSSNAVVSSTSRRSKKSKSTDLRTPLAPSTTGAVITTGIVAASSTTPAKTEALDSSSIVETILVENSPPQTTIGQTYSLTSDLTIEQIRQIQQLQAQSTIQLTNTPPPLQSQTTASQIQLTQLQPQPCPLPSTVLPLQFTTAQINNPVQIISEPSIASTTTRIILDSVTPRTTATPSTAHQQLQSASTNQTNLLNTVATVQHQHQQLTQLGQAFY